MKKKLSYSVLTILTLLISSCNNSIYIYDPIDPRLPIYSETGNNVAGALINEKLWRSQVSYDNRNHQPKINFNKTTKRLEFDFRGISEIYDKIIINIITDDAIESVKDLIKLDNKKVEIDGTKNTGHIISKNSFKTNDFTPNNSNGQFYIKNATYKTTESDSYLIISGTFGFNINTENGYVTIHYGRFDYKINEDNFRVSDI